MPIRPRLRRRARAVAPAHRCPKILIVFVIRCIIVIRIILVRLVRCQHALAKKHPSQRARLQRQSARLARRALRLRKKARTLVRRYPELRKVAKKVTQKQPPLRRRGRSVSRFRLLQRRPSTVTGIGADDADVGARPKRSRILPLSKRMRLYLVSKGRAALQWRLKSGKWFALGFVVKGPSGKPSFQKRYKKFRMSPKLWRAILLRIVRRKGRSQKVAKKRHAAVKQRTAQRALQKRRRGAKAVRSGAKAVIPVSDKSFLKVAPGGKLFFLFTRHKGRLYKLGTLRAMRKGLLFTSRYKKFRAPNKLLSAMRSRLPGALRKMPVSELPYAAAAAAARAKKRGLSAFRIRRQLAKRLVLRLPAMTKAPPSPPPISPHVPPESSPGAVAPEAVLPKRKLPAYARARAAAKPIPKQAVPLRVWPLADPRYLDFLAGDTWYPYGQGWRTPPWDFSDLRDPRAAKKAELKGDAPFDHYDDSNEEASYYREAAGL